MQQTKEPKVRKVILVLVIGLGAATMGFTDEQSWLTGYWNGDIPVPVGSLPVGIHIMSDQGVLSVSLQDPAQGIPNLGTSHVTYSGEKLFIEFRPIAGTFNALPSADRLSMEGV